MFEHIQKKKHAAGTAVGVVVCIKNCVHVYSEDRLPLLLLRV